MIRPVTLLAAVVLALSASSASADGFLTYGRARAAIQAKADHFAGQKTKIDSMYRLDDRVYSGSAEWQQVNPTGCSYCGTDPTTGKSVPGPETESCSLSLHVWMTTAGRLRSSIESFSCY